jgi:very-short-patch-repair endonuclease
MNDWMHATDAHGIASVSDLRGAGIGHRQTVSLVKQGILTWLMHGWYVAGPVVTDEERHVLMTRAMLRSHGGRAVAGHHSALLLLGLPTLSAELGVVRLSRRSPGPTRAGASLRLGRSVPTEVQLAESVTPAFATVQHGLSAGPMSALVAADAVIHMRLATRLDLMAAADLVSGHPHSARIADLLTHADGRHESPGETRLAHALRLLGIAATPQVPIPGSNAVVDFLVDGAPVVIEFDGRVKYGREADEPDPFGRRRSREQVLWEEKRREDRLRELGYEVVRVTWSDLDSPRELAARIRRAVERSRRISA